MTISNAQFAYFGHKFLPVEPCVEGQTYGLKYRQYQKIERQGYAFFHTPQLGFYTYSGDTMTRQGLASESCLVF